MKWVEVNIGVKKDEHIKRVVLLEFVAPLVEDIQSKVESWHFLWESKPWPKIEGIGTTLRLRFYGEDNIVDQIKQEIENRLATLERDKPELYLGHCFGRHGKCDEDYEGEADDWGTDAWKYGIKFLNTGSEFALALIKNQDKLDKSAEYKKSIDFYADRYVHCFLNNIFVPSEEVNFYLKEAIQRISHLYTGRCFEHKGLENLIAKIERLIVNKAKSHLH